MKYKSVIIVLVLSIFGASFVQAKTDLTGDVFGKVFSTMKMSDGTVPYGVTIDDINSGEACDNTNQTCLLKGFSWSDVLGWTSWDGASLQSELGGTSNFPDEYMAKATYKGSMEGFIWGEKFGWVQLSACSSQSSQALCAAKNYCHWSGSACEVDKSKVLPKASAQTQSDWGVYVDFCPLKSDQLTCESVESDAYCNWDGVHNSCVFDNVANPNGQPLRGFAWSQYLGWIKFGSEAGDSSFAGAFTKWFPDLSPPTLEALNTDKAWIPNESPTGTIHWLEFATDSGSPVDLVDSSITVNTDQGAAFVGCPSAAAQANGNLIVSQGLNGDINLSIPLIGLIGTPPYGFCKYTMGGVIYNSSGFGLYFGPEGAAAAAAHGVDVLNPAPNVYQATPITLYVRAGNLDFASSSLSIAGTGGVGDGTSADPLTFSPKDLAGNPIISVKSALVPGVLPEPNQVSWVRDIKTFYDLDQNSNYLFDRLDVSRNFVNAYPIPVQIENQLFAFSDPLTYPLSGLASQPDFAGSYLLDVTGFAPTTSVGNKLELSSLQFSTIDAPLPAVSPVMGPWNTSALTQVDASSPVSGNPLPHSYALAPALEVTAGKLDSDFIVIGQPVKATYNLINHSSDPLTSYGLDHVLRFADTGGVGEEVLELSNINAEGLSDTTGRTDPDSGITRYDLLAGAGSEGSDEFHSFTQNYHTPSYSFNSPLNNSGVYQVNGNYYASPGSACLLSPPCPAMDIDRSDLLNLPLMANGGTGVFTFDFTPSQYIGQAINAKVTFSIDQFLAYHAQKNPFAQSALYSSPPKIDAVEVKSIGLGTKGIVSGGQIFETIGGRDLDILTTTSAADLRREIRKNVAVISRNLVPCSAPQTLTSLSVSASDCISVDEVNKTVVAVYSGPGIITLGSGSDVDVPANYKYTILLLNGANLNIQSNLTYGTDAKNSLGLIVMEDKNGKGGNVYLSPNPTNMIGLLYAEGSLLSSPDGGKTLYYGAGGDANELRNQLFWQGAIVSSNTIGAGSNKILPKDVDCSPWKDDVGNCALAYDLDFIRRFTPIHAEPEKIDFAPAGYKFSGGGQCTPGLASDPGCIPGSLPTTVTLSGNSIDVPASKSLDTFFVERVNRPVPPGFSLNGGLSSSQDIR